MAIYDIIPHRGFNDEDVRDTLNANGGNTTRDNWRTFFTPSAKINKWAKYKPESYMQYACLQDNDRYNNL